MKRVLLAVLAAVLLLGACGDDGDSGLSSGGEDLSGEDRELADEIKASLLADDGDVVPVTDEEAECIATGMVADIGAETLAVIDFTAEDVDFELAEDDARAAAGVMVGCVDVGALMAEGIAEGGEVSDSSAECIADAIDDDTLVDLFTAEFQGGNAEDDPEFLRIITGAMSECLTDEEFAEVTG